MGFSYRPLDGAWILSRLRLLVHLHGIERGREIESHEQDQYMMMNLPLDHCLSYSTHMEKP